MCAHLFLYSQTQLDKSVMLEPPDGDVFDIFRFLRKSWMNTVDGEVPGAHIFT